VAAAWTNWSGRHRCEPEQVHFARTEADVAAVVANATRTGTTIRIAGAGHSHMPLVLNGEMVLDISGFSGLVVVDRPTRTARVRAGMSIHALGLPLHAAGLALKNQGDIDRQSIGGAVATGTHGTGRALQNLSASVIGARVVLASGQVVECSPSDHNEVFQVIRLHLGAVGVVTELQLSVREAYVLREHGYHATYEEERTQIENLVEAHRHFEFFWYPRSDRVVAKSIDETDQEPVYPLGVEGTRLAWSHEVLANHRPDLHTEMEFSVPVDTGPECLDQIRTLIRSDFPDLRWPVEYRTVASDDVWLSTAFERDVATISVHQGIDLPDEPLFRACEAVFRRFDGRPHWGKVNYFDDDDFARAHPRWSEWWAARDAIDPTGTFLNDYLRSVRPVP
jgi:FAD/FMN-containing dehydrogenase